MADAPRHDYLPIADHGIIGDLHSAALVGTDGTIDWYCHDRFDAPSVFASILDAERGGFFRLTPIKCQWTSKQLYVPDTNVLITRFLSQDGVGEVIDFMPVDDRRQGTHRQRLVRRVLCVKGALQFQAEVEPRFDYGRADADIAVTDDGAVFASPDLTLSLSARVPSRAHEGRCPRCLRTRSGPERDVRARARRPAAPRTPRTTRASCSTKPSTTGCGGSPRRATRDGGARS